MNWPWPRQFYGIVLDYFKKAGAGPVVFDILFNESEVGRMDIDGGRSEADFADAMAKSGRVILSMMLDDENDPPAAPGPPPGSVMFQGAEKLPVKQYNSMTLPLKVLRESAGGLGVVTFHMDPDGICRRVPLVLKADGAYFPHLAFAAYLDGRTPSPCVDCNSEVKFGALLGRARHLYDCDAVATGHYARIQTRPDPDEPSKTHYRLVSGRDKNKDQTYFLYGLNQEQLAHTRFPLGELTKPEARDIARRHGLVTADKPESQEICFVRDGDYRTELARRTEWQPTPGPLVDADGDAVGEHAGAPAYTIGQRSGLGVALGERQYVASIDTADNLVTLGRREDLYRGHFGVTEVSFIDAVPTEAFRARIRIRHRAEPVPGLVRPGGEGQWVVKLERPAWAPAPGQAAVFYDDEDSVIGGGRIDGSAAAAA